MRTRPEGPDPPRRDFWTCADVERWLKTGFRAMPYTPIYAPRGNTLRTVGADVPDATFDMVAFTGTVLGDKSVERKALLVWARAKATGGEVGGSVAQFCREMGWQRSRFERVRKKACQRVAAAKNADAT